MDNLSKLISFYRNAVSLHIIFVVMHGAIFSQLGHTGPLTVNKMALPSRYRRIWRHIHALIGRNTIALRVQRFAAGANIICLTYATDWWAVIGPVFHGESKSQATRELAQLGPCGSTSLASCQHVGRFCLRVCSLFVCNWRAKFKQNILVLCICRHDMVAIMMSNPGLSNKFDVDPLSNSDSKMSNSLFSRGRLITLPRSGCVYLSHLHPGRNYSHLVVKFSWTYHWAINRREVILNRFQNIKRGLTKWSGLQC